jgi:multidrug resistance efflux pump
MKWLVVAALAAVSGSSLTFLVWQSVAGPPNPVPEKAPQDAGSGVIEGIGYVEPASEVRQLAPKMGGVIKACSVKAGDVVRKGDLILALHDEKEAAAVAPARRQLEVARAEEVQVRSGVNRFRIQAAEKAVARFQADYQFAAQEVERLRKIRATRAASQSEVEAAEARRSRLEASLRQAEADLLYLQNYVRDVDEALMKAKVAQAEANLELAQQQRRDLWVLAPSTGPC